MPLDPVVNRCVRRCIRQDEAEQLRQVPLRRAECRELPVVCAQRQRSGPIAKADVPRVEVVVDEGLRRFIEDRLPLRPPSRRASLEVRQVASRPGRECRRRMVGERSPQIGHLSHRCGRLNAADPRECAKTCGVAERRGMNAGEIPNDDVDVFRVPPTVFDRRSRSASRRSRSSITRAQCLARPSPMTPSSSGMHCVSRSSGTHRARVPAVCESASPFGLRHPRMPLPPACRTTEPAPLQQR